MVARERLICESSALEEGGSGVRFQVDGRDGSAPAFAVRYAGQVRAYLNRCAHVPIELDWMPGHFFDLTRSYLVCAVHGAHYDAGTGRCVMGPCKGRGLTPLRVSEHDGQVFLMEDDDGKQRQA